MAKCTKCGGDVDRKTLACVSCGTKAELVTLKFTSSVSPTIVVGMSPNRSSSGDTEVHVSAPGARSQARINEAGDMTVNVRATEGIGRDGESRVASVLCMRLGKDGRKASYSSTEAKDSLGEDRILNVDGSRYVLQVTMVPGDSGFWREARVSSASTSVPPTHSAQWIEDCVVRKSRVGDCSTTVLALDALHFATLAEPAIIQEYLAAHGDPATRFGYASVWVVGPTHLQCAKIGSGSF